MMRRIIGACGVLAVLLISIVMVFAGAHADPAQRSLLIRNARVFDGTGAPAVRSSVLVVGDRIAAVGPHLAAPRGATVVDAHGMTLMPGLHDLHTHLRSPAYDAPEDLGKAYAGYLLRGITTVNDYSVSAEMIAPIRDLTRQPGGLWAPHINQAIRAGVPGGHGTEFGWGEFFTLKATTPRAAHQIMARALPYHPDVIKVFADGWRYGRAPDLNNMNVDTLGAIVMDAHKAGVPVVTHTVTLEGARVAASAGVDAVVHGVGDAPVDAALIDDMRAHHTAYVPTMAVYEPQEARTFSPGEWASLSPPEQARETARKERPSVAVPAYEARRWALLQDNLRMMHAAGIPIGIGTDSGIGGVYHGPAAIREVTLFTKAGFTPAQALVAATRTSAQIMGQGNVHGVIAVGQRADLILIDGKPDEAIEDIWNVRRVWLSGRAVPMDQLRQRLVDPVPTPLPQHRMAGPIYSGARGDGRTDLDTLPVDATDPGTDHSHIDIIRPEVAASDIDPAFSRPLFSVAQLGAAERPFAQLVLPLTRGGIDVADARAFQGIAFTVRGAGAYRLRLESYGLDGDAWFAAPFDAAARGVEVRLPFAMFASTDKAATLDTGQLRALRFELSGQPGGKAWLELTNVRFY